MGWGMCVSCWGCVGLVLLGVGVGLWWVGGGFVVVGLWWCRACFVWFRGGFVVVSWWFRGGVLVGGLVVVSCWFRWVSCWIRCGFVVVSWWWSRGGFVVVSWFFVTLSARFWVCFVVVSVWLVCCWFRACFFSVYSGSLVFSFVFVRCFHKLVQRMSFTHTD